MRADPHTTTVTLADGRALQIAVSRTTLERAIGQTGGRVGVQSVDDGRWQWLSVADIGALDGTPWTGRATAH